MANTFLNAQTFANAFLLLLTNELVFGRRVGRRFINEVTDQNGLKTSIKRPPRFVAKSGEALAEQPIVTGKVDLAVTEYKHVHIGVGDLERVQSFNDLMENETVRSAASELAHDVDQFLADKTFEFFSEVGTPGAVIASPAEFNKVHTRLMQQSVPNRDLSGVVTFDDGELIRGSLIGGDIQGVNRSALERTRIPILSEIDLFASNNVKSLVNGTRSGTILVAGANQNVNYIDAKDTFTQTLDLDGFAADGETIKRGEVFTIAGVNAVNPRTRQDLGRLQQFVVLEDAVTVAGTPNTATVKISPPIVVAGTGTGDNPDINTAFQTVTAAPADDAAVTFAGDAGAARLVRSAFHRQAMELATARLELPATGEAAFQVDRETGIGIRVWRGSDINTARHIWRFDMIYGAVVADPYLGARVNGAGA